MTATEPSAAELSGETAIDEIDNRVGTWGGLRRQPVALVSLIFLLAVVAATLLAPLVAPYSPMATDVVNALQGPSAHHLLGTDELGRDVLSRLIYGGRLALGAAFGSVGVALVIGVPLGLLAGYLGGWWDRLSMRACDVIQSVPLLLVAFAVIAVLGRGTVNSMIAVSVVFVASYMRLTRAVTLSQRQKLYIDGARVLGYGTPRILFRHLLVNVVAPLIVQTAILLGVAELIQAMLSFVGLGTDVGVANWGSMLDEARPYQTTHPLLSIAPGAMIALTILAFNVFGDGLRDALAGEAVVSRRPKWSGRRLLLQARGIMPTEAAPAVGAAAGSELPVNDNAILRVEKLGIEFPSAGGRRFSVIRDLSFQVERGTVFGLVGESGAGKSMASLAILGLVPPPGEIVSGSIEFDGKSLLNLSRRQWRDIRGKEIGIVFQDPMASLSPVHTIGRQIVEGLEAHEILRGRAAVERAAELLDRVGVPNARQRLDDYPHQFSGGMAQRAMIAAVLAAQPRLLIADEPTTALDVTIQKQVLALLLELRAEFDMSILLITHDLGVVAETCDRVGVMYAGQLVEEADAAALFTNPRHPYTAALLAAVPGESGDGTRLATIPGSVPPPWAWPQGCRFHPRCDYALDRCCAALPPFVDGNRCIRADELELKGVR